VKQVGELAVFLGVAPDQEDILIQGITPPVLAEGGTGLPPSDLLAIRRRWVGSEQHVGGLEEGRLYGKETDW